MMSHTMSSDLEREALELLPWYVNGTLEGKERELVRSQVLASLTCRKELERLRRLQDLMRQHDPEAVATDRAFESLMSRIRETEASRSPAAGRPRLSQFAMAASLVAAATGLAAWWAVRPLDEPAPYETLTTPQTGAEQLAKSHGNALHRDRQPDTAAQTHGAVRAQSGFDINQMASEYRALRASVLRLWFEACTPEPPHVDDIVRFNEAIDQALAESIAFYTTRVEQSRNLFLGMLGHDLRTPLQAMVMGSTYLGRLNAGAAGPPKTSPSIASGTSPAFTTTTVGKVVGSTCMARIIGSWPKSMPSGSCVTTSVQLRCAVQSSVTEICACAPSPAIATRSDG